MDGTTAADRRAAGEEVALPSRAEALDALRSALKAQAGPVLVTGEPGVGKTWLYRRLLAELPPPWRSVIVDVPPEVDPRTLCNLIAHRLGLTATGPADAARLALADFLGEATADGTRWVLVIDEAHNASNAVLEEVRVLGNRLGRPDGFAGLVLAGQTSLACRLAVRPLKALAARLAAHVHLRCLDADEAQALVQGLAPGVAWDIRTLERYHRDAAGNPRRLLRAATRAASSATGTLPPAPSDAPAQVPPSVPLPSIESDAPLVGPYKPPLLVGDGMVEVGWDGGLEPEPQSRHEPALRTPLEAPAASSARAHTAPSPVSTTLATDPEASAGPEAEATEIVEDRYTSLQAWNEWAENRDRAAAAPAAVGDAEAGEGLAVEGDPSGGGPASVWVDPEQTFAPYGQLFSRLRQGRDVNESS
jgi:general secretion pathway protein A